MNEMCVNQGSILGWNFPFSMCLRFENRLYNRFSRSAFFPLRSALFNWLPLQPVSLQPIRASRKVPQSSLPINDFFPASNLPQPQFRFRMNCRKREKSSSRKLELFLDFYHRIVLIFDTGKSGGKTFSTYTILSIEQHIFTLFPIKMME